MKKPDFPPDENKRLETLRSLNLLDTAPEERFDRLTRMAKRMFGVPISLVSIVDAERQWFKSAQGLDATETPREVSFCGHAILGDDVFVVPDAKVDERFADNPLVTGDPFVRFYAGAPLKVLNGSRLGTLCLVDRKPRMLDADDLALLKDLAAMAEQEIAAVQLATLDELTMISNRRGFRSLAQHTLNVCHRKSMPATLMVFDLNGFKQINDTFGHAEGDRALVAFADTMRAVFRDSDVFARTGGDEFVALMTDCDDSTISAVLDRFDRSIAEHNAREKRGYDLRYSVGHVTYPMEETRAIDDLMHAADEKMYAMKKAGKRSAA